MTQHETTDRGGSAVLWLAGGGTGGHLYPGLAVAKAVQALRPEMRCVFFGTTRPVDGLVVPGAGHRLIRQVVQPWPGFSPLRWPGFVRGYVAARRAATAELAAQRPLAVLGLGGYAAAPAIAAARSHGVPVAIHNPDALPGRANRRLARGADVVFCQWPVDARRFFGGVRVEVTGCPVRAGFFERTRDEGIAHFGLDPSRRTLLVTGASQGAKNLNDAAGPMAEQLGELLAGWQIVVLAGPGKAAALEQELAGKGGPVSWRVLEFTDDMDLLMAAADLVISRAGASTCAELAAAGRASVLVPYPYDAAVHQRYNAEQMVAAGAAVLVDDRREAAGNARALAGALEPLLRDPARLAGMSAAARSAGRPDAAGVMARWLLAMGAG